MDSSIRRAMMAKLDESLSLSNELLSLRDSIGSGLNRPDDFLLGLIVGRVYNSFHYQTRRILQRDASPGEFADFVLLLNQEMPRIKRSLEKR